MEKNIFIISQSGLDSRYGQWTKEATGEFMEMFPEYKNDYPVANIGSWDGLQKFATHIDYMRAPEDVRSLYIPTTDGQFLVPYQSVDWSMATAKLSAINKGHPQQIDAGKLLDLTDNDPTCKDIPQIDIILVKDDAYAGTPDNNFVYGMGRQDRGLVLSMKRLEQQYGDNPEYLKEVVKTLVMHELGHVFLATREGRHNVANRDGYGQHCDCPNCIMRTDTKAKSNTLTDDRLEQKRQGKPPLCPECIAMTRCHFAELSKDNERLFNEAQNFNMITHQTRTYS